VSILQTTAKDMFAARTHLSDNSRGKMSVCTYHLDEVKDCQNEDCDDRSEEHQECADDEYAIAVLEKD
jgi:hypothetical protein